MGFTFLFAFAINIFFYILAVLPITRDARDWQDNLKKPLFFPSIDVFYNIEAISYLLTTAVLFRLLSIPIETEEKVIAIILLIYILIFHSLSNYLFFGFRSIFLGFLGKICYLIIAIILEYNLETIDLASAVIFYPYLLWLTFFTAQFALLAYINRNS